jgi:hypothetical protein
MLITVLHHINHCVASIIYLNNSKVDLPISKLLHLILKLETIRRPFREIIAKRTDITRNVTAVARCITNHKHLLGAVLSPFLLERLVKAALNIFREVCTSSGLCLTNK